jgi:hypothetical protein
MYDLRGFFGGCPLMYREEYVCRQLGIIGLNQKYEHTNIPKEAITVIMMLCVSIDGWFCRHIEDVFCGTVRPQVERPILSFLAE